MIWNNISDNFLKMVGEIIYLQVKSLYNFQSGIIAIIALNCS